MMYSYMSNRLEGSLLSSFIVASNRLYSEANGCIDNAKEAYEMMNETLIMLLGTAPWVYPAWMMYMKLLGLVLGCHENVMEGKYTPPLSCEKYWEEWRAEEAEEEEAED